MFGDKKSKLKSLKTAIRQIEKTTKQEGIVQVMGEKEYKAIETFPSGILALDLAVGNGGIPRGRVIEIFGPESSGKTLISTRIMASVQRLGGVAALVDAEHAFDPVFASKLGLNSEELIISQPDTMEDCLTVVQALIQSGSVDIITVDSVAAMVPRAEFEAEVGKQTVSLQARIMSQEMRKIIGMASTHKVTVIFINQIRDAVGVFYGDPTTTPGGKALKFYSSIRINVSKMASSAVKVKRGNEEIQVGHGVRAKVVKNKVAPPFRKAEFMIYYDGRKTDEILELAELAIDKGIIQKFGADGQPNKNGRTYLWPSEPAFKAMGKDNVADELKKFPNVASEVLEALKTIDSTFQPEPEDQDDWDDDLTPEEFEEKIQSDARNLAEETSGWDQM